MIPFTEIKNPKYATEDNSIINVEVFHVDFGWLEFSANPIDSESYGAEIYDAALNGDYGNIAEYVDPVDTGLGSP